MARDPLELRGFSPNPLTDTNDPPRGSSFAEAIKDAFVERLREHFAVNTPERRAELPTVRKYATPASGTDAYATYLAVLQEFPDLNERLPHVAVLGISGTEKPLAIGRPLIANVQAAPRVVGAVAEPFALPAAAAEVRRLTVAASSAPGSYSFMLSGIPMTVTTATGTEADAAAAIAAAIRAEPALEVFAVSARLATVDITLREQGVAFELGTVGTNLTASLVTAAGAAGEGRLRVRTWPGWKGAPTDSTFVFGATAFPAAAPAGAASAAGVADAIMDQARYILARGTSAGRLELRCGYPTPNEVEVLPADVSGGGVDVAVVLGLAVAGAGGTLTASSVNGAGVLVAASGTPWAAVVAGQYATLAGWTGANAGRWKVTAVGGGGASLTLDDPDGLLASETAPAGATWFVGLRDDWQNPLRPVAHRYLDMGADLTVALEVYAKDTTVRREVTDLVWRLVAADAELTHFAWYGRSVFDDTIPDEHIQIGLNRASSLAGDQDFARPGGDEKARVYSTRISVPCIAFRYRDRTVEIPVGPSAGLSWAFTADSAIEDDSLPGGG